MERFSDHERFSDYDWKLVKVKELKPGDLVWSRGRTQKVHSVEYFPGAWRSRPHWNLIFDTGNSGKYWNQVFKYGSDPETFGRDA